MLSTPHYEEYHESTKQMLGWCRATSADVIRIFISAICQPNDPDFILLA